MKNMEGMALICLWVLVYMDIFPADMDDQSKKT